MSKIYKIYFDGCSRMWGGELENKEQERFSFLVSKELGAEEYNIARPMASNDRIIRHLIFDHNISDFDLAVIQMTFPSRTEYYDKTKNKFLNVGINHTPLWKDVMKNLTFNNAPLSDKKNPPDWSHPKGIKGKKRGWNHWTDRDREFWLHYYTDIYTDHYGTVREKIIYQNIKDHCKVKNVPLIFMTNNNWDTNLEFDIEIEHEKYPKNKGGHETKEGHRVLAEDVLSVLKTGKKIYYSR